MRTAARLSRRSTCTDTTEPCHRWPSLHCMHGWLGPRTGPRPPQRAPDVNYGASPHRARSAVLVGDLKSSARPSALQLMRVLYWDRLAFPVRPREDVRRLLNAVADGLMRVWLAAGRAVRVTLPGAGCQVLADVFVARRRRSCSLMPPHTPWSCLVSSAKAGRWRWTGRPAHIALAWVI